MSSTPFSKIVDSADVAGGEAIFSSDGLAPLPVPNQTVPAAVGGPPFGGAAAGEAEDVLDTGEVLLDPSEANHKFNSAVNVPPQIRLFQLQQQVDDLERELRSDATGSAANEELTHQVTTLAARLDLAMTRASEPPRVSKKNSAHPSSESGTVDEAALEQRLLRLERALGASAASSVSDSSFLERLAQIEKLLNRVDEKSLDDFATRAKVIRSDLEAAAKAKTKLSSATSSSAKEDAQVIAELHQQLQALEGVSEYLPVLSERLQHLSQLHVKTAQFQNRLQSTESLLQQTLQSLSSMEESVTKVEQGLEGNLKVMESNVNELHSRLQ